MELTAVDKKSVMYSSLRLRTARSGRYQEFGGRPATGVALMYSMKGKKTPVPELASAIWSEFVIGGIRYRRFHCIKMVFFLKLSYSKVRAFLLTSAGAAIFR